MSRPDLQAPARATTSSRRGRGALTLAAAAALAVLGLPGVAVTPAAASVTGPVTAWGTSDLESVVPASLQVTGATAVAAGSYYSLALTPAGQVVGWGYDNHGRATPPASLTGRRVTAIAAGTDHALALTADGQVVGWGDDSFGQATPPASLTGRTVTAIAADGSVSLALTSDGQVVGWGDDRDHQAVPPASLTGRRVTAIATGGWHSLALTADGQVVQWGYNASLWSPVPDSLSHKTVTAIAAGDSRSLALTSDGSVTAWGDGTFGPLDVPASLTGTTVTAIDVGFFHSVALTSDGRVVAWGSDLDAESDVPALPAGRTVVAVSAGQRHNLAITTDAALRVTASPQPVRVELGAAASFSASASGDPAPSVQWQRGTPGGAFHDVAGATSGTYTFVPVAEDGGAAFRAVFRLGTATATTSAALLTVNRPPTATSVDVAAGFETPTPVTLTGSDPDGDPLTYALVDRPAHGTLTGTPPRLTYSPAAGYSGPDAFTFRTGDGSAASAVATVGLTVAPKPDGAPTATPLTVTAGFQRATPVTLSGSDPDGDPLSYVVVGQPGHGTLTGAPPRLTYTPAAGYRGPDAFTYRVDDGRLSSAVAEVAVTVTGPAPSCVPRPPRPTSRVDAAERDTDGVVRSPRLTVREPGELLVAFVSAAAPAQGRQAVTGVDGGRLTWRLVQRDSTAGGTSEIWQAYAAAKPGPAQVTAHLARRGQTAALTVVAFGGAGPTPAAAAHHSGNRSAPRVSLTAQASGSTVWAVGRVTGSRYRPKPGQGQQVVHARTFARPDAGYWTQRATAPTRTGSTVSLTDRAAGPAWGYAAVEVRGACG